ncbi:PREDICTED: uncharacterized protein LOC104814572 [Tarenaya hassleriana]|uniref:uncharacterized protein LOC104814572 n=1 Tax=Tarenaya hassleriana TaxID=28532 RepID=UPI00053C2E8D|nr:PREDICTED: uncharacterized protein LOC104814572 [Tarenaya hassleriana]
MYCNLTRSQGFPMAIRVSLQQAPVKCFHTSASSSLAVGFCVNPKGDAFADISSGFSRSHCKPLGFLKQGSVSVSSHFRTVETGRATKPGSGSRVIGRRVFSSLNAQRADDRISTVKAGDSLPWLESNTVGGAKRSEKGSSSSSKGRSSWEESAKRLDKAGGGGDSIWVESSEKTAKNTFPKARQLAWEKRDKRADSVADRRRSGYKKMGEAKRNNSVRAVEDRYIEGEEEEEVEEQGQVEEEVEVVDDHRGSEIKNRFDRFVDVRDHGRGKPGNMKWDKQEAWGRKTWKEATESTVPRMVGEGVYGVGPVLAALSAGRREFYALYVQEGLDMSSNNRKKKDKKGFERILKIAEKIGLSIKETSKHDLNMVVDNRPHQGLILDASPLEMVRVKELDPMSSDEEKPSVWVALDEVTDPHNLGAIIRSAYFFGATGIVLCAKNSAPLSGVVSKSSAGSLEVMELRYCKNMMQFLTSSADNGWRVIGGSVSSKAIPLNEISPGTPTILVLGNEGTGLRPLVERSCTELVRINGNIPIDIAAGESNEVEGEEFRSFLAVESLNVSVAAGLLLHHFIGNGQSSSSEVTSE